MAGLKIQNKNGTWLDVPTPSKINVTDELVWGSNTGRTQSGKMIGDFKGFKAKVEVQWSTLTKQQMKTLRDALHSTKPFFKIQYWDIENSASGGMVTKTVYMNEIPRQLYSLVNGYQLYQEVEVHFIEQ